MVYIYNIICYICIYILYRYNFHKYMYIYVYITLLYVFEYAISSFLNYLFKEHQSFWLGGYPGEVMML